MLVSSLLLSALAASAPHPIVAPPAAEAEPPAAPAEEPAPATEAPVEAPAPAVVEQPRMVAVLDLKVEGGDAAALANALATVMASEISSRPGTKAVSRNELKSLLAHTADANLLGCQSANCAVDIAKLVDADLVVAGTLGVITGGEAGPGGKALILTLSLLDPTGPAVVQRVDVTWRGDPEEMVTVVPPTLDRLFDGAAAASFTGAAEIFAPAGTTVAIDGKSVGTAPVKKVEGLPIGVHVVEVTGTGYVPARKDIVVSKNESTVARLTLEEEPFYTQWWFWTAVGGGTAVAIAGGTTVAILAAQAPPTRVVVKSPLPSFSAE